MKDLSERTLFLNEFLFRRRGRKDDRIYLTMEEFHQIEKQFIDKALEMIKWARSHVRYGQAGVAYDHRNDPYFLKNQRDVKRVIEETFREKPIENKEVRKSYYWVLVNIFEMDFDDYYDEDDDYIESLDKWSDYVMRVEEEMRRKFRYGKRNDMVSTWPDPDIRGVYLFYDGDKDFFSASLVVYVLAE